MSITKFNKKIRNLIADFRSLPREESRAYLRKPKQVGLIVDFALANISIKHRCEHVLLENWQFVIDGQFCDRCKPVTILANDVLLISCENSILRQELELIKFNILQKIITLPRCKHIKDIKFRIADNL